jgi:hypothetical protein
MPSGPSGRSPDSRTVYDFSKLPNAIDGLRERYGDRIDPPLKQAMDDYQKTMSLLHQSDVARTYRWSGQYAKYVAYLAARPELTRRLISRAMGKRMDRRSRTV